MSGKYIPIEVLERHARTVGMFPHKALYSDSIGDNMWYFDAWYLVDTYGQPVEGQDRGPEGDYFLEKEEMLRANVNFIEDRYWGRV